MLALLQAARQSHNLAQPPAGRPLDVLASLAQLPFNASAPGRANRISMSVSTPLSPTPSAGAVHVSALKVVNPRGMPSPGASLLLDGNGDLHLLFLAFLGLHAGDGHVRADGSAHVYRTALFEAQLHAFMGFLCAKPDGFAPRVQAGFQANGSGGQAGRLRNIRYDLSTSFVGAEAAGALGYFLCRGDHHYGFTQDHRARIERVQKRFFWLTRAPPPPSGRERRSRKARRPRAPSSAAAKQLSHPPLTSFWPSQPFREPNQIQTQKPQPKPHEKQNKTTPPQKHNKTKTITKRPPPPPTPLPANKRSYMAHCDMQPVAASFLAGSLLADGYVSGAEGAYLTLGDGSGAGEFYFGFTTRNPDEAGLIVELLNRLGSPIALPAVQPQCYDLRVNGRQQVARLLRFFDDAFAEMAAPVGTAVSAAWAAFVAGAPQPATDRATLALAATGIHSALAASSAVPTDPLPLSSPAPSFVTAMQPRKGLFMHLMSLKGVVADPRACPVVDIELPLQEHRLLTALARHCDGAGPSPPLLRAYPTGSMHLLVAAAPAHNDVLARARTRAAECAESLMEQAATAARRLLPAAVTDRNSSRARMCVLHADASARAAAAVAWQAAQQQQQQQQRPPPPALSGALLPQDATALLAGGNGVGHHLFEYTAYRRLDSLPVPHFTQDRGGDWAQLMTDALRERFEWHDVQFGGGGNLQAGGGQVAGSLVSLNSVLGSMWSLSPRGLARAELYGDLDYIDAALDAPYLAQWNAASSYAAAQLVWAAVRGGVTPVLRLSLGAPEAATALLVAAETQFFIHRQNLGAGARYTFPFVPAAALPDLVLGGVTNSANATAATQSRLPPEVAVFAGLFAGALGATGNEPHSLALALGGPAAYDFLPPLERPAGVVAGAMANVAASLFDNADAMWTLGLGTSSSDLLPHGVLGVVTTNKRSVKRTLVIASFCPRGSAAAVRRRARRAADLTLYGTLLGAPRTDLPASLMSLTQPHEPVTAIGHDDAGYDMVISAIANHARGGGGHARAFDIPDLAPSRTAKVSFLAVANYGRAGGGAGGGGVGAGGGGGAGAGGGGGAGGGAGAGGSASGGAGPHYVYPDEVICDDYRLLDQYRRSSTRRPR